MPRPEHRPLVLTLLTAWPLAAVESAASGTTDLWNEYLRSHAAADTLPQAQAAPSSSAASMPASPAEGTTAPIQTTFSVYGGVVGYGGDTPRNHALLAGAYGGVTLPTLGVIEAGVERLRITCGDDSTLLQSDATLVAGRWCQAFTWWLRAGGHGVEDHDHGWRAGRTAFAGAWWVPDPRLRLRLGADLFASRFCTAEPAPTALQASPAVSWRWAQGATWNLGQDAGATVIHLDQDAGFDRRVLWSVETRLRAGWGPWWCSIEGWSGARLYAVGAGGFAVYDMPGLYRHGAALNLGRLLADRATLTLGVGRDAFRHLGAADRAHADHAILSLTSSF